MDFSKLFDKGFEKLDVKSDFNLQSWSFKVYLLLCEKKVKYCVDKLELVINDQSTAEEKEKHEK